MTKILKEKKQKKKKKVIDYDDDVYHLGCPSYPNCDIAPNGCIRKSGSDDVE